MMDEEKQVKPMILTYFPIRAKAQIFRLLCEYLYLPYKNNFTNPMEWEVTRKKNEIGLVACELPYLQDGNFFVASMSGILTYIIQKANRPELLGSNLKDQMIIDRLRTDFDLKQKMSGIFCSNRSNQQQCKKTLEEFMKKKMVPSLEEMESICILQGWCLGYITVLDFVIYEMITHVQKIIPEIIPHFPKLLAIRKRIYALPEISSFQNSERAIKQYCPMTYMSNFKQKTICGIKGIRVTCIPNKNQNKEMDLQ